jgi:hypothetical protein
MGETKELEEKPVPVLLKSLLFSRNSTLGSADTFISIPMSRQMLGPYESYIKRV